MGGRKEMRYMAALVSANPDSHTIFERYTSPSISDVKNKALEWCRETTKRYIARKIKDLKAEKEELAYWKKELQKAIKRNPRAKHTQLRRFVKDSEELVKALKERIESYRKALKTNSQKIRQWKGVKTIFIYVPVKEGWVEDAIALAPLTPRIERIVRKYNALPEHLLRRKRR